MKKLSLLAASVAIALTGCGGSDDDSTPKTPETKSVVITGFDGYFKNAVLFEDTDNDGAWDEGETVLGLTDENGQVTLAEKPANTLALQTITPNGNKQKQLIALNSAYAGIYTVDMDHPGQAMAHEVVFRAPNSSNVISPITDLVAIEMANDETLTEEAAIANVKLALTGSEDASIDLYSDFVSGDAKNAELHKTAQILTESKANNPSSYEKKATEFAQAANTIVSNMTEEEVADVNNKPVIIEDSGSLTEVTNSKLTISEEVKTAAEADLIKLEIVKGTVFSGATVSIEGLFLDTDQSTVATDVNGDLAEAGIEVSLEGNQLVLAYAAEVTKAGEFEIILTAKDLNNKAEKLGEVSVVFTVNIDSVNQAPVVVESEQTSLQSIVDNWQLQQGELFEQTLNIFDLFEDKDGQIENYTASISVDGLSIDVNDNAIITVKGTPTKAYAAGQTFTVSVTDNEDATAQATFTLPEVEEGTTVPVEAHELEGKTWYYLEHGSSVGDTKYNYSRIWCDSIKFEDGVIYGNLRTLDNLTQCTVADDADTEPATYVVEDGLLIATFSFEEDGETFAESFSVEVVESTDGIANGEAKTIIIKGIESDEEGGAERYTYYADKSDAETRIQIKSNDGPEARMFPMTLPTASEGVYATGFASVALSDGDADLFLEFEDQNFTCDDVEEFYRSMTFTGEGLGSVDSLDPYAGGFECYDQEENNINYAVLDFDLPALTVGNVYSFVGKVEEEQGAYIEAIKFNIEWTGEGNNE